MIKKMRQAKIRRKTAETDITISLVIDGRGQAKIYTGIPFADHMLTLLAKHGLFDLNVVAKGDLQVDIHHTNEDVGITLGQVFQKALVDKKGIRRYGYSSLPMDEVLAKVSLDFSGRPHFHVIKSKGVRFSRLESYSFHDMEEFLHAFCQHAGITMHVEILSGRDSHHIIEAVFKALAKSLDMATQIDPRVRGVPSTKGRL
jgi:imidazoleglycerol-phosphate dehydratase